jgi:hypothetical protein
MIKTIDEITIVRTKESFILTNARNNAQVMFNEENKSINFQDSFKNTITNYPLNISINFEVFKLTIIGETLNCSEGIVRAYLSTKHVQELAHKTFYEEGQTHIFDFINLKFNVTVE